MGRGVEARNLGVGSVRGTLVGGDWEVVGGMENGKLAGFNQSLLSHTDSSILQSDTPTPSSLQAGIRGLSLWLDYLTPAATFSDKGFFALIINTLVFAAQHDPKQAPCGLVRSYNSIENYTFVMGPTSDAAQSKLPWNLAIAAMGILPTEMLKHGHGGRWAELMGRIKLDGAWIGKILILRGDRRTKEGGLCGVEWGDGERR